MTREEKFGCKSCRHHIPRERAGIGASPMPTSRCGKVMKMLTRVKECPGAELAVKVKVFVCSPYRGETPSAVEANLGRARSLCRFLEESGMEPRAPHLYYPQFLNDADPREREKGMAYSLAWLNECMALLYDDRVPLSEGMGIELRAAKRLGKDILKTSELEKVARMGALQGALQESSTGGGLI